ncbi:hypothetical protein [Haloarcula sediminis]|uniref:hypothetical protein n=1 Tax=Haloarcula sediminis TaxID=3111777 RepID=UPI002D792225|nr:hypothetical protein [Haloarcula sp. CK38]
MRIPIPNNKLVAFTLVGALLTTGIAGALAMPGGLAQSGAQTTSANATTSDASQQVAADAPTPNQNFSPEVQTQSGYEDEEHEEYEEDEEEHEEDEEEHEEDEEDDEEYEEEYDEDE